jgi:hypothetical protein
MRFKSWDTVRDSEIAVIEPLYRRAKRPHFREVYVLLEATRLLARGEKADADWFTYERIYLGRRALEQAWRRHRRASASGGRAARRAGPTKKKQR